MVWFYHTKGYELVPGMTPKGYELVPVVCRRVKEPQGPEGRPPPTFPPRPHSSRRSGQGGFSMGENELEMIDVDPSGYVSSLKIPLGLGPDRRTQQSSSDIPSRPILASSDLAPAYISSSRLRARLTIAACRKGDSLVSRVGFRVSGLGFRVQDVGFRVWGSEFRV